MLIARQAGENRLAQKPGDLVAAILAGTLIE
jgi:hypothetical protein